MSQNLLKNWRSLPMRAWRKFGRPVLFAYDDWQRFRKFQNSERDEAIVNQISIRVSGMRRTGNHAIIKWIEGQCDRQDKSFYHLNDLRPNENPYRSRYHHLKDFYPQYERAIQNYREQASGDFKPRDCLIYSYEDLDLRQIAHQPKFDRYQDIYLGRSAAKFDLIILRDPFNLFASRFKIGFMSTRCKVDMVELWISYAKEFLGETNRLPFPKVCVNYNQWTKDFDYRRQLAEALGLEYHRLDGVKVSAYGGGSSFDKRNLQDRPDQMQVEKRWRHFADNPAYLQCVRNPEVLDYSERIFGRIPGTESLYASQS